MDEEKAAMKVGAVYRLKKKPRLLVSEPDVTDFFRLLVAYASSAARDSGVESNPSCLGTARKRAGHRLSIPADKPRLVAEKA